MNQSPSPPFAAAMAQPLLVLCLVLVLSCGMTVAGEDPHLLEEAGVTIAARIPDLLASVDVRDRAWAAYRAGQLDLKSAIPALRAALSRSLEDAPDEHDASRIYLVDALIRLGDASLAAAPMARLLERQPWLGVILAARRPEAHQEALLGLVAGRGPGAAWTAAVNLLVGVRNPAVLPHLLDDLPISLTVTVVDPGVRIRGSGRRRRLIRCGDGHLRQDDGFPPPVTYQLGAGTLRPGWTLLVDGPEPVGYHRREGAGGIGSSSRIPVRGDYGLAWAARVLGRPSVADLPVSRRASGIVKLQEEPDLLAAVGRRVAKQRDGYRALLQQLVEAGHLGDEYTVGLAPMITVAIDDQRQVQDPALPALPEEWTFQGGDGGKL